MQVAGAVVEPVKVFAVGQLGLNTIAQPIILMTQLVDLAAGGLGAFAEEAA